MTIKNVQNIAVFSIIATVAFASFGTSNAFAEETRIQNGWRYCSCTNFTFRDGVEVHSFPVFNMGENFVDDSGVSFSVEGSVIKSPLFMTQH